MMKPRFTATSVPTLAGVKMIIRAAYGRRLTVRIITSGAVVVMAALFMIFSGRSVITFAILAIALAFFVYFLRALNRMSEKVFDAMPDKGIVTEFSFMEDGIHTANTVETGMIVYKDIVRIWENKTFLGFMLSDGSAFVLARKDISGDPDKLAGYVLSRKEK